MGLLDGLFNLTPEQNQSLLAASAKMLEMSGPSRVPQSLGQILGASYGAFNNSMSEAQQLAALKRQQGLQEQLMDWKIKDAEADFGHQQGTRVQQARIAERIGKLYGSGVPEQGGITAGGMTSAMPDPAGDLSSTPAFTPDPRLGRGGLEDLLRSSQALISGSNGGRPGAAPGGNSPPGYGGEGPPFQELPGVTAGGQASAPSGLSDWLKTGLPPAVAMSMAQGGHRRPNQTQQAAARMLAAADIYASENDFDNAEKRYKAAASLMPQVDRIEMATDPQTNKPVRVITYKDGREEVSAFGAKRDMVDIDLGGVRKFVDRNQVQPGDEYVKSQTPDSRAVDARFAGRAAGGAGGAEPSLDDDTLEFLADRALRGDRTALQNMGRGAQGAANLVAVNQRIARKAKAMGVTGGDLASINADYQGQVAGLRTSGTISARIENAAAEAAELAPLALAASEKVARSGLLPFGRAEIMFNKNTNDPALNEFATANIGLATAYAGAMARGGKSTVSDMEHAREILSTAKNHEAYKAIVGQIELEIQAAQRAPQRVRNHLRSEISGRGGDHGGGDHGTPLGGQKTMTLNDIRETARRSGRTTAEVTAAARAKGFKIGGQ